MNSDDFRSDASADLPVNQIIRDYLECGELSDPEGFLSRHPLSASPAAVEGFREFIAADIAIDRVLAAAGRSKTVVGAPGTPLELRGFDVHEVVGQGGMGVVYRARQQSVDRDVALKLLHEERSADPRRLTRFRNEARVLAKLQAAHVVSVIDVVASERGPVLVMPFIHGTNLSTIIRDRFSEHRIDAEGNPAPRHLWADLDEAAYLRRLSVVFEHLLRALAAVHAEGLLHRDIKPSNILIDNRDCAWLSDFGLARDEGSADFSGAGGSTREINDTLTGTVAGTNGFISPEGRSGGPVDQRSDLFAVGVSMYQALTGRLPYGREPITINASLPDPPSSWLTPQGRRSVPGLDAVVLSALHPDPRQRCRTATELLEQWQAVWQGSPGRKAGSRHASRFPRLAGGKRWIAAVVAVVALTGYFAFNHVQPPESSANSATDDGAKGSNNGSTKSPDSTDIEGARNKEAVIPPPGGENLPAVYTATCKVDPPDVRAVLIPLDEKGEPLRDAVVQPVESDSGTLKFTGLSVGWYLLEAAKDGHGFIQAYRRVPKKGELGWAQVRHLRWEWEGNSVTWSGVIVAQQETRPPRMALFADTNIPETGRAPFWLDTMEVTCVDFRRSGLDKHLRNQPADPNYAVRNVPYDIAVAYAESVGKRLPTEFEFEFAATNGYRTRFPWGNERFEDVPAWDFGGPVGTPAYDRTNSDPPCFGLMSNVAEWTGTLGEPDPQSKKVYRIVRGGPFEILEGGQPNKVEEIDPRTSNLIPTSIVSDRYPQLGFRCARSEKPLVVKFDPQ